MSAKHPIVRDNGGYGREEGHEIDIESLNVGTAGDGGEVALGRGLPYTEGMVVLTTDATATPTTDGGNFIDVSAEAASESGSTFSFQGTAANHTILVGSEVDDIESADKAKHYGIGAYIVTAAVEIVKRSFVVEIWNGSQWVSVGVMACGSPNLYKYANEIFIRSANKECVNFGIASDTVWVKKSINGKNLYWARFRITNNLTTAPVFEWWKLVPSGHVAISSNGAFVLRGLSRFRKVLATSGNVFGESGGVTNAVLTVGAGGTPTQWSHILKNCLLNSNGDIINYQFSLPRGIDTSLPLNFYIIYIPTSTGTSPATCTLSCLPTEVVGVLEADPTGGIVPVPRTLANTESRTAKAAQTVTHTNVDVSQTNKFIALEFSGIDISNYYEGDIIVFMFEAATLNGADIAVLEVEVSGSNFSLGERV